MNSSDNELKRNVIGIPQLVFFVISAVGPCVACLGSIPVILEFGNGIGAAGMFIIAMLIWIFFAVGYSAMGRYIRNTGAFYAYISQGMGKVWGIAASYMAVAGYMVINIGMYGFFGYAVNNLLYMTLHIMFPWWIIALLGLIVVTGLSYMSIDIEAKIVTVLMVIEIGMIFAMSIGAILFPSPEGYTLKPYTISAIISKSPGIAIMYALGCFVGFEITAVFSEEAKNLAKTVPIATYASVIILGVMYSLASYAAVCGWGTKGLTVYINNIYLTGGNPGSIYIELTRRLFGNAAALIPSCVILSSIFTTLFSFHNMLSRYFFSMGRTGFIPKIFEIVHPKFKSPYRGVLLTTVITGAGIVLVAILGWDPFNQVFAWLVGIANLDLLVLYTVTALAIIGFFRKTKRDNRIWNTLLSPALAAFGLIAATVLCIQNFPMFTGASPGLGICMMIVLAICFVLAVWRGFYIKNHKPDIYKHVGENIL